ncbi:hypothetical protein [Anaerosporobacter sp.]
MLTKKIYNIKKAGGVSLFLCVILLGSLLTGCKTNGEKGKSDVPMGRYREQELKLPEDYQDAYIISILSNMDNKLEVYMYKDETIKAMVYDGKDWSEKKIDWLDTFNSKDYSIDSVILGKDKQYYALITDYSSEDYKRLIYKDDGTAANKIDIPWLETKEEGYTGEMEFPHVDDVQVLSDGSVVILPSKYEEGVHVFDPTTGEQLLEYSTTAPIVAMDEALIGYSLEQQKLLRIDMGGSELASYDFEATSGNSLIQEAKGDIYSLKTDGISILQKDGSLWQTIVDGNLTSLSDQTMEFRNLAIIEKEKNEYAVLVNDSNYKAKLYYYYFDEKVASIPSKQLNVYSLYLNPTIRQGIIKYQSENPDVLINYTYAIENGEGDNANLSDTIRALNTELLGGNGADILVLDGLPRDSYLEKGVLEDIGDIAKTLVDDGTLSKNIMQNYIEDGACYYVPLRFQVPIAFGNKAVVEAMTSLDKTIALLESKNSSEIFNNIGAENFASLYFALFNKELVSVQKTINEEELGKYLDMLQALMKTMGEEEISDWSTTNLEVENAIELDRGFDLYLGNSNKNETFIAQLVDLSECQDPLAGVREANMYYDTINNQYVESGVIGVNKASKNKDLARDFLKFLLSEKVQSSMAFDGFPVNTAALDKIMDNSKLTGMTLGKDGAITRIEPPTAKEVQGLYDKMKKLDKPISYDSMLSSLVIEQVKDFLDEKVTKEEAIQNIMNVANGYLAE